MSSSNTFSMVALAGATVLSAPLSMGLLGACASDPFITAPSSDDGGTGGDGGSGGDGGGPILGTQFIPKGTRPTLAQKLPAMNAFLLWEAPSAVPEGKSIDHYDVCWANGTLFDLGGESDCPNAGATTKTYSSINSLQPSLLYFWKIRANYGDGTTSYYSSGLSFRTDDRLAGWWPMDEASGAVTADKTGKGNTGNLKNGATFTAGLVGNALQLDGIDDFADMGNSTGLQLGGPLTISAWVKSNGTPTAPDTALLNLGALNYALTYHTDAKIYFYIGGGGNSLSATMSPNAWHHIVGTFDGSPLAGGMNLYLDGVLVATRASSLSTTGAAANLWVGRYNTSYFHGLLDNVSVYADTLDANGVINQYCASLVEAGVDPLPAPCQP